MSEVQDVVQHLPEAALDNVFRRHRGPVTCVAGIPGTRKLVSTGYDSAVAVFDLESGEVRLLGYHAHLANRVTVNDAGSRAATSSSDYTIRLWDLRSGKLERILRGHSDDVEDFTFIDSKTGASVSWDSRILVWDLTTGAILRIMQGHEGDILSVNHFEGKLFTSGDDMTLRVWDLQNGKELRRWGPFETEADSCAIDSARHRVILGSDDGYVRVFDSVTGETVTEVPAHGSGVKKVAVAPRSGDIVSAAYDQQVLVWKAPEYRQRVKLEGRKSVWERSLNWLPDGSRVVAGTFDGTVIEWDPSSGRILGEIGDLTAMAGNLCLNEISANRDGYAALVSDDGLVRLARLSPAGVHLLHAAKPASGRVLMNAVTMDRRGKVVVAGTHDQKIHVFRRVGDALTDETVVPINEGPINSVRVSWHAGHEGEIFVACYSGMIVRVGPEGKIRGRFRAHGNAAKALRLHPERALGVSCGADRSMVSWDLEGRIVNRFLGHMSIVDDVDIDPGGRFIASVGRDFTLMVHGLDDAKLAHAVALGRRSPKGVCFARQDTVIVSNYWGELIRVELPGEKVSRRQTATNGISSVCTCGEHVAAVSYDGGIFLVEPEDLHVVQSLQSMRQRVDAGATT